MYIYTYIYVHTHTHITHMKQLLGQKLWAKQQNAGYCVSTDFSVFLVFLTFLSPGLGVSPAHA